MRLRSSETGIWVNGYELLLIPCKGGFSYDWQDKTGRGACSGWVLESREDAEYSARQHLLTGIMPEEEAAARVGHDGSGEEEGHRIHRSDR